MSYVIPAVRGTMGSTTYYQANMQAREIAAVAKLAGELAAWKDWSIFERFQRDLATKRVAQEIVPYLVRTRDRFFGALIVLVYEPDLFEFEPLDEMTTGLPAPYLKAASKMGFLTINGGELVALDGQHRLSALRNVVTAGAELEGPYRDAVTKDELCVIFIRHENFEKTRRIFNKVNRYAKPTSPSDNIITSEDDGCAIVTRWLVEPTPPLGLLEPLPPFHSDRLRDAQQAGRNEEPLVEWRSTKLENDSRKLTTLTALYQTVQAILEANGIKDFDERHRINRPSDDELARAYVICSTWWSAVLSGLEPYVRAVKNPWMIPTMRQYREKSSLLFRPVAQVALFGGLAGAVRLGSSLEDAVHKANKIRWQASYDLWTETIIFANGHINTRPQGIRLAGRLVSYFLAGHAMSDLEKKNLMFDLCDAKSVRSIRLPQPIA